MKTWYQQLTDHLDEAAIYIFTVLCTILGNFILTGTRPEFDWLTLLAALTVSVILCLVADLMQGKIDTPQKRAGKRRNFKLNLLISGVFGIGSGAIIPALVKMLAASIGVNL